MGKGEAAGEAFKQVCGLLKKLGTKSANPAMGSETEIEEEEFFYQKNFMVTNIKPFKNLTT